MENFRTFWPKWRLSKILTKIEIFINFDEHRYVMEFFLSKSEFLKNMEQNNDFLIFWPKSRFNDNFDQNNVFFEIKSKLELFVNFLKNRDFSKYFDKMDFCKFSRKSWFFEIFD